MIVSYLAYKNQPIDMLIFFLVVASHPEDFRPIEQPEAFDYEHMDLGYAYNSEQIRSILSASLIDMPTYCQNVANIWAAEPGYALVYGANMSDSGQRLKQEKKAQEQYSNKKKDELERVDTLLRKNLVNKHGELNYTCDIDSLDGLLHQEKHKGFFGRISTLVYGSAHQLEISYANVEQMRAKLNERLQVWRRNKRLVEFVNKVQAVFDLLQSIGNKEQSLKALHCHVPTFASSDRYRMMINAHQLPYDVKLVVDSGSAQWSEEQQVLNKASQLFARGRLSDLTANNKNAGAEEVEANGDVDDDCDAADHVRAFPIGVSGGGDKPCQLSKVYREYLEKSWRQYQCEERRKKKKTEEKKEEEEDMASVSKGELLKRLVEREAKCAAEVHQLESLVAKLFGAQGSLVLSCLISSGLWPRSTPMCIVKRMLDSSSYRRAHTQKTDADVVASDDVVGDICGAVCVAWCLKRQAMRAVMWARRGDTFNMERELANEPHANWSPKEHPQWLAIQLEMDIIIRATQVRVAKCMIDPPKQVSSEFRFVLI